MRGVTIIDVKSNVKGQFRAKTAYVWINATVYVWTKA